MMRAGIFTILICAFQLPVYAQSSFIVTGAVVDDQNLAIPFANAAVYSGLDSAMVGGAASDETGVFAIQRH